MMADDEARAAREEALLQSDARLIISTIARALGETPPASPAPDHANYLEISGDIFREHVELCLNTALVLEGGSFCSANVLARAAYERAHDVIYLVTVGDKVRNAIRCRARALLEVAELFSDQPSGQDAARRLARLPDEIVAEQRQYRRAGRGWSGLNVRELAEAVGVIGHREAYSVLSWFAHSRIPGYGVERQQGGEGFRLHFGERESPRHRHGLANFTRRFMHRVYGVVAQDWLGHVPPLATSNPEDSRTW